MQNPYLRYKEQAIQTASPGRLILMLYEALIKSLAQAIEAINKVNMEAAHNHLVKAQNIIFELDNSLNMKYELAHHLHTLYDYLARQAVQANVNKDATLVEQCLKLAVELRDAWLQVVNNPLASEQGNASVNARS